MRLTTRNIREASGVRVFAIAAVFCILICSGCATASKTLSDEEIAGFNTEFFSADGLNNRMLGSEYAVPEEINLFELFYNGVNDAAAEVSEEELALLTEFDSQAPYLDIIKITAGEMDTVLRKRLGLGLEETKKTGLENFCYLAEYDSYYLIHGDTNYDPCTVTSGTRESDGKLILEYTKEYEEGRWAVTLQETDEGYLFLSNCRID